MQVEIIMAGFGGQGVMLMGKMLAESGMQDGKEVSWLPSYGPEMRGGTANCTVVVSDRPVGSPIVKAPRDVVAMNLPSLDKFESIMRPDGILVINESLIERPAKREDVKVVRVKANDIALACGSPRSANMVALGAYIGATEIVNPDHVIAQIEAKFAKKKPEVAKVNVDAFKKGLEVGRAAR